MTTTKNITVIERDPPLPRFIQYRNNEYQRSGLEHKNIRIAKNIAMKFETNGNFNVLVVKIKNVKPSAYYVYVNERM